MSLFKVRLSDGQVVRRYTYAPAEGEEISMTTLVAVPQGLTRGDYVLRAAFSPVPDAGDGNPQNIETRSALRVE